MRIMWFGGIHYYFWEFESWCGLPCMTCSTNSARLFHPLPAKSGVGKVFDSRATVVLNLNKGAGPGADKWSVRVNLDKCINTKMLICNISHLFYASYLGNMGIAGKLGIHFLDFSTALKTIRPPYAFLIFLTFYFIFCLHTSADFHFPWANLWKGSIKFYLIFSNHLIMY